MNALKTDHFSLRELLYFLLLCVFSITVYLTRGDILEPFTPHHSSLSKINCEVEALDQLGVLDSGDEKLRHLHFQEVWWQLPNLVLVNLELDAEEGGCVWANLEHSWKAEECHTVKHYELLLLKCIAIGRWLWPH